MTVSQTISKVIYSGNGSTTAFAFSFQIFAEGDLRIILRNSSDVDTVQTITTHYTVSASPWTSGGTVTMVTAPASGETLTIKSAVSPTQSTDYPTADKFPAAAHELALDKLTILLQQREEELKRTFQLQESTGLTAGIMPDPTAANILLTYDGVSAFSWVPLSTITGGDILSVSAFMQTVLDDATAVAAMITLLDGGDLTVKTSDGAILNLQTSDTTVTATSVLGRVDFTAPNEASLTDSILLAASIAAISEGTFAADNNATRLSFLTGASGAAAERLNISSAGHVSLTATTEASATGTAALTVAGGLGVAKDVWIGDDLTLDSDGVIINFGDSQDVTLTHVAGAGLLLNGAMKLEFSDHSQYIHAPSATTLTIAATDEIELNATLVDVNANLDVSGTYQGGGTMTTGGNIVIPDAGNIGSASDTDALAISSGGNLGIGIAPTNRFHIKQSNNGVAGSFRTERSDTTAHSVIYMGGDDDLYIQNQSAAGDINFYTDAALALSIEDGNLILGTANKGIYLGVTSAVAANHLDDYEEGTFTATLTATSAAPTSAVTVTANYVKIGRLVHFDIVFTNVSLVGASGNVRIEGLPFGGTVSTTTGPLMSYVATITGDKGTYWYFDTASLNLYYNTTDGGWVHQPVRAVASQYFWTSGTYRTPS
jgi:hypothetical protein